MKFERVGKKVKINGKMTDRATLTKLFRHHFSKAGWEKLWQDIKQYGRVHVALIFVEKGKGD